MAFFSGNCGNETGRDNSFSVNIRDAKLVSRDEAGSGSGSRTGSHQMRSNVELDRYFESDHVSGRDDIQSKRLNPRSFAKSLSYRHFCGPKLCLFLDMDLQLIPNQSMERPISRSLSLV